MHTLTHNARVPAARHDALTAVGPSAPVTAARIATRSDALYPRTLTVTRWKPTLCLWSMRLTPVVYFNLSGPVRGTATPIEQFPDHRRSGFTPPADPYQTARRSASRPDCAKKVSAAWHISLTYSDDPLQPAYALSADGSDAHLARLHQDVSAIANAVNHLWQNAQHHLETS